MENSDYRITKNIFLQQWSSEFLTQVLVTFDLLIKNLKTIEYKSEKEKRLYLESNSTYEDIFFLYFIDYIDKIVSSHGTKNEVSRISHFPIYIDYAFERSLSRINNEKIKELSIWLKKIMEVNKKYVYNSQTADYLIAKYIKSLNTHINDNKKSIHDFFSSYSTSNEIALMALSGIRGLDSSITEKKAANSFIGLEYEKNFLLDNKSRMLIPLMLGMSGTISSITPSRLGSVIFYCETMQTSEKEESIRLNHAQVVSSLFQIYPGTVKNNTAKNLFFDKMNLFKEKEIIEIQSSKDLEEKVAILTNAIYIDKYKKHFNEIRPIVLKSIRECISEYKEKGDYIKAEMLYDISEIIKKEIGKIELYIGVRGNKDRMREFLNEEISNLIELSIKEN